MTVVARVAFIGHLSSVDRYREVLAAARGPGHRPLDREEVERSVRALDPMPISEWSFRSLTGRVVSGCYIDMFLLVDRQMSPRSGITRVRAACREAARVGARIAALGGFSSILGEMDRASPEATETDVAFTTGNTLTAAVIAAQVEVHAPGAEVTVVGAAGDVGSGLCRILAARGHPLVLVGRSPGPLAALQGELPRAQLRSWAEAAPSVQVAVLVASAVEGEIDLAAVPAGALVLDAGHPANARPAGQRYARAGRVLHAHASPVTDLPAVLSDFAPDESHACLAEALVLAFEERYEPYSRGRGQVRPDRAAEILALAGRHGIRPATLSFV